MKTNSIDRPFKFVWKNYRIEVFLKINLKNYLQLAVECLLKTSEIYTDMGRFTMAAKNHVTIAEL